MSAAVTMNAPLPPGPPPRPGERVDVADIARFDERIDVRSPSEFAEDHIPGALNLPVLDDAERTRVGTLYVQGSAFEARKLGAAIAARNIARMVETHARDKPPEWRPLVYCWRGGQRSRAVSLVFAEIGWRAVQLAGGSRAWRRHVTSALAQPDDVPALRVVCGLTGSGKSRLLRALASEGAQVLDLEHLARHRGSLLGDLPGEPQPSQKWFESQLHVALRAFDRGRTVYVESESKRIGSIQLPDPLLAAMRAAPCVRLDAPLELRVALLLDEYAHFLADDPALAERLAHLAPLHGRAAVARWTEAAARRDFDALVRDLLEVHYDPLYARSIERNFPRHAEGVVAPVHGLGDEALRALARRIVATESSHAGTVVATPVPAS
jgi:tRNA 2-selenouridine synthase